MTLRYRFTGRLLRSYGLNSPNSQIRYIHNVPLADSGEAWAPPDRESASEPRSEDSSISSILQQDALVATDATEAPGAAERAAPGTPPDETEREMHAIIIRQIEAQRNGADGSFLARDWIKEAGTRPAA